MYMYLVEVLDSSTFNRVELVHCYRKEGLFVCLFVLLYLVEVLDSSTFNRVELEHCYRK